MAKINNPVFDKLIVVMIDALRSDFLYDENSKFKNLHEIYNQGHAMGFTAYANPPTVTLPRLKGILTGSTPIFLDAILNVAEGDDSSNLKDHDSILKQFNLANKKINFYGDDTWIKLFGTDMFNEYEGTTSFFVKDYTEVDNNVTRHIEPNFKNNNWDVLILHYLGLDHIGHAMGSSPPEMDMKQAELDIIIKTLYDKSDEDTLILVLGDHGMTNSGNHGGSTDSETHAGMCFISKKFEIKQSQQLPIENKQQDFKYLKMIQQVDLVPTLMSLFNLPIPKNNVGVLIEDILDAFMSDSEKKTSFQRNKQQLDELLNNLVDFQDELEGRDVQHMKLLQKQLMDSSTNYNYSLIYCSMFLAFAMIPCVFLYTMEFSIQYLSVLALSLVLGISSFATSFIEEEHKVWYWLMVFTLVSTTLMFKHELKFKNVSISLGLLTCLRIMKSWNNSGQKFFYYDLISNYLKNNEMICWLLFLFTLIMNLAMIQKGSVFDFTVSSYLSSSLFLYKLNWESKNSSIDLSWMKDYNLFEDGDNLAYSAKKIFATIAVAVLLTKIVNKNTGKFANQMTFVTYFLIIQSSVINIPMFSVFMITEKLLNNSQLDEKTVLIIEIMLEHVSFFFFGNTNSIATIDLINAYNGVSKNYKIEVVGLLMLCSTFAPSIYFSLQQSKRNYKRTLQYSLVLNGIWSALFLLSCFIGRYHLFVWSVFSPKLCYYLAWNIFMNLIIKVIVPLILF
ncbi:hypothetical protein ACO0OL_002161 [Hanseniaspora opuntiae]